MSVSYGEMVDVAALMALEGARTAPSPSCVRSDSLYDMRRLSRLQSRAWLSAAGDCESGSRQRRELIEEILVSEPRVRLIGAILTRIEDHEPESGLRRISRQLLHDHALAKRLALTELLAESFPIGTLTEINGLRRRMERWTDMLLAVAGVGIDAHTFGFDEERVREHLRSRDADEALRNRLILCGLKQAVPRREVRDRVRSRIHRSLHECSLGLVAAETPLGDWGLRTSLQQRIYTDHLTADRVTRLKF